MDDHYEEGPFPSIPHTHLLREPARLGLRGCAQREAEERGEERRGGRREQVAAKGLQGAELVGQRLHDGAVLQEVDHLARVGRVGVGQVGGLRVEHDHAAGRDEGRDLRDVVDAVCMCWVVIDG